jgi:hypothetical protein
MISQKNVQGAELVLLTNDMDFVISGKDEFDLQHKIINVMSKYMVSDSKGGT